MPVFNGDPIMMPFTKWANDGKMISISLQGDSIMKPLQYEAAIAKYFHSKSIETVWWFHYWFQSDTMTLQGFQYKPTETTPPCKVMICMICFFADRLAFPFQNTILFGDIVTKKSSFESCLVSYTRSTTRCLSRQSPSIFFTPFQLQSCWQA